ncbi:MAG: TRAP transporter small permease subunit [Burkholderiaceae bacterium]
MRSYIFFIDQLSKAVGHAFAWLIMILTLGTSYEVFVRYVLNNPTSWAFDMSYLMYGALFLMAGAYTLSRDGHVRGDVLYRLWRPRVQAGLSLVLFFIFFFPGVLALVYAGYGYAYDAIRIQEVSVNSPVGVPVWPLKMLIPIAGLLLTLQGTAEVCRCILCLREGQWPARLHDVEELESILQHGQAPGTSDAAAIAANPPIKGGPA